MSRNNVTMIDDLPYLEDLERESFINGVPPAELKQISKFIRNTAYNPPYESGMNSSNMSQQQMIMLPQQQQQPQPQQQQQQFQGPSQIIEQNVDQIPLQPVDPNFRFQQQMHRILSLSCVDVAEHTANCIVCSKLYNTDTSLYIIVISILLLVSAFLFKKVLDLQKS